MSDHYEANELRDIVRQARMEQGLTQQEVAARAGRSQKWVSRIEMGITIRPDVKDLRTLAEVLKLDLDELILATQMTRSHHFARQLREVPKPEVRNAKEMRAELLDIAQRLDSRKLEFALSTLQMIEHAQWNAGGSPGQRPQRPSGGLN